MSVYFFSLLSFPLFLPYPKNLTYMLLSYIVMEIYFLFMSFTVSWNPSFIYLERWLIGYASSDHGKLYIKPLRKIWI